MKVSYNRESDVLLIHVSKDKVDYAEEMGPIIVHFTKDGKPVHACMLEILDASEVISEVTKIAMKSKKPTPLELRI